MPDFQSFQNSRHTNNTWKNEPFNSSPGLLIPYVCKLDVDTCIDNTIWSTKTISNYPAEDWGLSLFLMLRQLIWKCKKHIIYGFVLNDRHCTSYDCCYFKLVCLTGVLKNGPIQTFQGYLSEMTETALFFLCRFSLDFLEFLSIFSISSPLLCLHLENLQIDG